MSYSNFNTPESQTIIERAIHDKEHPYLMVAKSLLRDKELSIKDRGILTFLLSFPDTWKFHHKWIAKEIGIGINQLYQSLKKIIAAGYGSYNVLRNEKGQILKHIYKFSEIKKKESNQEPFHQNSEMEVREGECPQDECEPFHHYPEMENGDYTEEGNSLFREQQNKQQNKKTVVVVSCLKDKKLDLSNDEQATIMRYDFAEERLIAACEFCKHPSYKADKSIIATIIWHCKSSSPPRHPEISLSKEKTSKFQEIDPEMIEMRRARFKQMRTLKWDIIQSKQLYCENIGDIIHIGESKLSLLDKEFDKNYLILLKQFNLG